MVTAIFYDFAPEQIAKALQGMGVGRARGGLLARHDRRSAALRRCASMTAERVPGLAAELAGRAHRVRVSTGVRCSLRNRALPWPEPVLALWHAVALLREHRGDAHIAVLDSGGHLGSRVRCAARGRRKGAPRIHDERPRLRRRFVAYTRITLATRGLLRSPGNVDTIGR